MAKRQAEYQLRPDNWDQEDPVKKEEEGGFRMASKEVLEKRVIRTAKKRTTGDSALKPIFSGFNKTHKTSFDFLANLTNGSKANNDSSTLKSDTTAVSSSSMITSSANTPSTGIFSLTGTSTAKPAFGQPPQESIIFSGSAPNSGFTQSVFNTSKPDSTVNDNLFKGQPSENSSPFLTMKPNTNTEKPVSQVSSTLFGASPANVNNNNSPFSLKTTPPPMKSSDTCHQSAEEKKPVNKIVDKREKELVYYNNLKGLNESVSAWIRKHVEETPLCILTPIFKDYEKHLKNIQDEYAKSKEESSSENNKLDTNDTNKGAKDSAATGNTLSSTLFSNSPVSTKPVFQSSPIAKSSTIEKTSNFTFGIQTSATSTFANNFASVASSSSGFTFGIKSSNNATSPFGTNTATINNGITATTATANNLGSATTPSTGFSFGIKSPNASSSPFATNTNTSANNDCAPSTPFAAIKPNINNSTPFSFGIGKPFSFNANIKKNDEPPNEVEDNEDEPPKVEYTPITEENSVYEKKCKVFVKKENNYTDKGVGTLYIKKIEDTGKHQLLVRANTSLGNVLINLILSSSLPTQRMGKNNVMMICMPTPDAKPPPTSILIRVKTSEDADELLETLNKYKA